MFLASTSSSFLSVDCFAFCMILYGFVKAKHCTLALNVGVLPLIVHPALCRGLHCFYLRCRQICFETAYSPSFVRRLVAFF